VHEDDQFEQLVRIVAAESELTEGIVEKDYWVTHTLWALQGSGIQVFFKGGTSLSKGFGLTQRFSEDVDVTLNRGDRDDLPALGSLRSNSTGATTQRRNFYEALHQTLDISGTELTLDRPLDGKWVVVELAARYPVKFDLPDSMRPFVLLEAGLRAWYPPTVPKHLSSHLHDHLEGLDLIGDYVDNRPRDLLCVHPFVTLVDKLDAIVRRYPREDFAPEGFIRHYEDIVRVIGAEASLPTLTDTERGEVVEECLRGRVVEPDNAAFTLEDEARRETLMQAYEAIAPMFWGDRVALEDCCETIQTWLEGTPLV